MSFWIIQNLISLHDLRNISKLCLSSLFNLYSPDPLCFPVTEPSEGIDPVSRKSQCMSAASATGPPYASGLSRSAIFVRSPIRIKLVKRIQQQTQALPLSQARASLL
jgi:hypothetical protein